MGHIPFKRKNREEDLLGELVGEQTQILEKVKFLQKEQAELKRICLRLESQLSEQLGKQRELKRICERIETHNSTQRNLMELLKRRIDLNKKDIDSLRQDNQSHRSVQERSKNNTNEVEFAVSPINCGGYDRDISTCTEDNDKVSKSPVMLRTVSTNRSLRKPFSDKLDAVHKISKGNFTTITSNVTSPKKCIQENKIEILNENCAVKSRDINTDAPYSKYMDSLNTFPCYGKRKMVVCNVELAKCGGKLVGSFDLINSDENL